jgi:hypothetical protein
MSLMTAASLQVGAQMSGNAARRAFEFIAVPRRLTGAPGCDEVFYRRTFATAGASSTLIRAGWRPTTAEDEL